MPVAADAGRQSSDSGAAMNYPGAALNLTAAGGGPLPFEPAAYLERLQRLPAGSENTKRFSVSHLLQLDSLEPPPAAAAERADSDGRCRTTRQVPAHSDRSPHNPTRPRTPRQVPAQPDRSPSRPTGPRQGRQVPGQTDRSPSRPTGPRSDRQVSVQDDRSPSRTTGPRSDRQDPLRPTGLTGRQVPHRSMATEDLQRNLFECLLYHMFEKKTNRIKAHKVSGIVDAEIGESSRVASADTLLNKIFLTKPQGFNVKA